jgi:hypothetical protein
MHHGRLQDLLDEMLEDPHESFIASNSKRAALITLKDGSTFLIEGDFSGTDAENEAEARRVLRSTTPRRRRRRVS